MIQFKMIAIDLDGTLIDSAGDLHQAVVGMQRHLNTNLATEEDVRQWIGNGIERLVHRALTNTMHDDAEPEYFNDAFSLFCTQYHQTNGQFSTLYDNVNESLNILHKQRVPLVCVTNKARIFAEPVLQHHNISRYFEHLIAGDDVPAKKPDPAALLEAASRCNVDPGCCAMIGDSISDIKAAKAAGFVSVCVSYGYNHGIDIRDIPASESADLIIDSFAELEHALPELSTSRHLGSFTS